MVTKGIFKRLLVGKEDGPTVDILVARVAFRSRKYGDWFADSAGRVCDYERKHGNLFCSRYVVGDVDGCDPDVIAPINMCIKNGLALDLIKGSDLIEYSSSYIDDVTIILALTSTVQAASVYNVRRDVDEIVREVCSDYERVYGNGC